MRVEGDHINMKGVNFRDATLIEAKLISANISHADLHRADLTNGDFSNSTFNYSEIISADAVGARFINADLSNAHLTHSDFTNANFTNANFEKTNFGDAVLTGAAFSGASFRGADISAVQGLTQTQLNLACGNTETKLPNGPLYSTMCGPPFLKVYKQRQLPPILRRKKSAALPFTHNVPPQQLYLSQWHPQLWIHIVLVPQKKRSSIDLALIEIEATLRDLPISSPLHKRLTKSRILLQQAQTNDSK